MSTFRSYPERSAQARRRYTIRTCSSHSPGQTRPCATWLRQNEIAGHLPRQRARRSLTPHGRPVARDPDRRDRNRASPASLKSSPPTATAPRTPARVTSRSREAPELLLGENKGPILFAQGFSLEHGPITSDGIALLAGGEVCRTGRTLDVRSLPAATRKSVSARLISTVSPMAASWPSSSRTDSSMPAWRARWRIR